MDISALIKKRNIVERVYGVYEPFFTTLSIHSMIVAHTKRGVVEGALKEHLYTIDFWIYMKTIARMHSMTDVLQQRYGDASIA